MWHLMSLRIGSVHFNRAMYDGVHDVLYLGAGEPRRAVWTDVTDDGHALRYAENGRLIGLNIVGAARLMESDDEIRVGAFTLRASDVAPLIEEERRRTISVPSAATSE